MSSALPDEEPEDGLDRAWQQIMDNYGDRAILTDPEVGPHVDPLVDPGLGPKIGEPEPQALDAFAPPRPGPVALPDSPRLVAWLGVLSGPMVMFLAAVLFPDLPTWSLFLVLTWFVGGLAYLVATMDNSRRHDGPDDGAVV